jgi:hypothetical protein
MAEAGVLLDTFHWPSQQLTRIRAQRVILAVPQFVVQRLMPTLDGRHPGWYEHFSYAPWLVANLTLKHPLPENSGAPLSWDNVLYDSPALGYVYANHMSLLQKPSPTVLTYYWPLCEQPPEEARKWAYAMDHATWVAFIINDLRQAHPSIEDSLAWVDVKVWGHGMVRPTPGFMTSAARREAAQSIEDRVFFAHSDLSGISIFEEAFYQGNRAATALVGSLGRRNG